MNSLNPFRTAVSAGKIFLLGLALSCGSVPTAWAQESPATDAGDGPSARKAFFLSLAVPGLGHRYAEGGRWSAKGTAFGLADAALWIGLAGARWQEVHHGRSYRTLAALHAGAQVEGKNRPFFVSVGGYDSSAEYVEFLLRARAWDRVAAAEAPENAWDWDSPEDRMRYREIRQDAERMGRRVTWMASALVANRFLAALSALRAARRGSGSAAAARVEVFQPTPGDGWAARLVVAW